jgi:hypothetical protein
MDRTCFKDLNRIRLQNLTNNNQNNSETSVIGRQAWCLAVRASSSGRDRLDLHNGQGRALAATAPPRRIVQRVHFAASGNLA